VQPVTSARPVCASADCGARHETEAAISKLQATLPLVSEQRDIRKALLAKAYGSEIFFLQIEQQVVEAEHGIEEGSGANYLKQGS
jgi:hypothetical protein